MGDKNPIITVSVSGNNCAPTGHVHVMEPSIPWPPDVGELPSPPAGSTSPAMLCVAASAGQRGGGHPTASASQSVPGGGPGKLGEINTEPGTIGPRGMIVKELTSVVEKFSNW
jgi:hypothetical protein